MTGVTCARIIALVMIASCKDASGPASASPASTPADATARPIALAGPSDAAAGDPPLEIFVENAADPFSRADGTGYANDVVRAAFAAVGVPITLTVVPYVRCKILVTSGTAAACVSMSWVPEFEGRVKFADVPLLSVQPVYFESVARPVAARSEAELGKGVAIGTMRGYEYPDSAMQVRARGATFVDGASEVANLKKLAAGRLDCAMVMANLLTGADHWVAQAGVRSLVREAFRSPTSEIGFLGASLRHPRGRWALDNFNRGVEILTKEGTMDKLKAKWAAEVQSSR